MKLIFHAEQRKKNVSIDLERRYRKATAAQRRRREPRNVSHAGVRPAGSDRKTEVLIVGGGLCGLLCAYFLKQAGVGLYGCGGRPNLQRCQRKYHSQNHIAARADLQSADSGVRQRKRACIFRQTKRRWENTGSWRQRSTVILKKKTLIPIPLRTGKRSRTKSALCSL